MGTRDKSFFIWETNAVAQSPSSIDPPSADQCSSLFVTPRCVSCAQCLRNQVPNSVSTDPFASLLRFFGQLDKHTFVFLSGSPKYRLPGPGFDVSTPTAPPFLQGKCLPPCSELGFLPVLSSCLRTFTGAPPRATSFCSHHPCELSGFEPAPGAALSLVPLHWLSKPALWSPPRDTAHRHPVRHWCEHCSSLVRHWWPLCDVVGIGVSDVCHQSFRDLLTPCRTSCRVSTLSC